MNACMYAYVNLLYTTYDTRVSVWAFVLILYNLTSVSKYVYAMTLKHIIHLGPKKIRTK